MPIYLKIIIALAVMAAFLGVFIAVFLINKHTKIPEDCPKNELPSGCSSCMLSCGKREDDFSLKPKIKNPDEEIKKEKKNINKTGGKDL